MNKHLSAGLAAVTVLLSAIHTYAGTFTTFGPKTFTKGSGKPVVETYSFNVKNPNTAYTLKIYNGRANSEYSKVSSAIINLNGSTIFDTSDFNQQVSFLQKQVSVSKSNNLSVELRSSPGSGLTIIIEGDDNDPPSVAIASPVNDTYANIPSATINGTASDATSWVNNVTVNGTKAVVSGETFSASINLAEGKNTITATATDAGGNSGSANINLYLDTVPPAITLDPLPSLTNNPHLTITGMIDDASPITALTVNGKDIGAIGQPPFQFSSDITLTEGANTITVIATDKAGNTGNSSVRVNLDTTAPTIAITSPTNDSTVNASTITVTGTIDDNSATVTVNGITASVSNNTFTATGTRLIEDSNIITVTATDLAGNASRSTITVNYSATSDVKVAITDPRDGSTLTTPSVYLYGTVTSSIPVLTQSVNIIVNGKMSSQMPLMASGPNTWFFRNNLSLPLQPGKNTITVTATDTAGKTESTSTTVNYALPTGPIISITSPINGSAVNTSAITVAGATDESAARITVNGVMAGIYFDERTRSYLYTASTSLTAGDNVITVTAIDQAGNSVVATITVRYIADNTPLDTTPPVITITSPTDGSYVKNASVTISGSVNEYSYLKINGQDYGYTYSTFSKNAALIEGENVITVTATDQAGNTTTSSIKIICDTIPPVITITSPADGSTVTTSTITILGNIDDNTATVTVNGISATVSNGTYSATDIPLSEGSNKIVVTATDQSGTATSKSMTIYRDTVAPLIKIYSPPNGVTIINNTYSIDVIVATNDLNATIKVNGSPATMFYDWGYYFKASGIKLTEGINIISATATDIAGNIGSTSITVNYIPDITPPVISITSPEDGWITNRGVIWVTGAIDDDSAFISVNGMPVYYIVNNTFTAFDVRLVEGTNTITATATDPYGNIGTASITVIHDRTPPTVLSTAPGFNETGVSPDEPITVTFSEAMNPYTATTGTFTLTSQTGQVYGAVTCSGNAATFKPNKRLSSDTVYTATIRGGLLGVRDVAGNPLAYDYAWVFKTGSLPIEITEPYDGATINKATAIIKGTINYQTQEVGITVNGVIAETNGNTWTAVVPLQVGQNTIEATATDTAGSIYKHAITINTNSIQQPIKITTNPQSGVAPLNTTITIDTSISSTVTSYKIDFEGDGVTDLETTNADNITHTYDTPGLYYPTVTVTDSQGNTYLETTAVNVLSKEEMDALLKGKWEGMKGALGSEDITTALNYFSADSKQLYSDLFTALASYLPQFIQDLQDIRLVYIENNTAKYRIKKSEPYGTIDYPIYFVVDTDGMWKIDRF